MSSQAIPPVLAQWIDTFLAAEHLPVEYRRTIEQSHVPLAARIATRAAEANLRGDVLTVGLCGPQGSGKSTMTAVLKGLLETHGLAVAVLSLDDLYLTLEARETLSQRVHPLLRTRGVPGTHDIALGLQVFAALREPGTVALPSFDKARDDRRPYDQWPNVEGPVQVILFEGWCVGAQAQPDASLTTPINALERNEDPAGIWRRYVNAALAGEYQQLFAQIDFLILLQAPDFDVVYQWRLEQEQKLRQQIAAQGGDPSRLMNDRELARFISHYERLTRHILTEMPSRANVVIPLDAVRAIQPQQHLQNDD